MTTFQFILLQGTLFFGIFTLFQMLIFRKAASFQWHRYFLLVLPLLSYGIPTLFSLTNFTTTSKVEQITINLAPVLVTPEQSEVLLTPFSFSFILFWIWAIGFIIVLARTAFNYWKITKSIPYGATQKKQGCYIHESENVEEAWTFLNHVVVPAHHSPEEKAMILAHEITHAQQRHTLDLLYAAFVKALLWWNPFSYLWVKNIKENHEFLADQKVLSFFDPKSYGYLLLNNTLKSKQFKLTHTFFNPSILKRRIKMMKKQSKIQKVIPVIGIIGLSGIFMAFSTQQRLAKTADEVSHENTIVKDSVYKTVDKMPEFPGGQESMIKWLSAKIIYPEKAKKEGIEGNAFVSFVINKSGKVQDIKVLRSSNALFEAPAMKVVQQMPRWTPGEKDGKKVNVEMVLPFQYKLPE